MTGTTHRDQTRLSGLARPAMVLGLIMSLVACEQEVILEGQRFDTRLPLSASAALQDDPDAEVLALATEDGPRDIALPDPVRVTSWEQRTFDTRNRLPHATLSQSPTTAWVADIGSGNSRRQRINTDPVAADGRVFTLDADTNLVATSIATGAPLWSTSLLPDFDRGGGVSGGNLALAGDRLYVTTSYGELIALDTASGAVIWRQRFGVPLGAPTVTGNRIHVVAEDGEAWSLNADDGTLRWQIPVTDVQAVLSGGASPALSERHLILPFPTGEVQAVFPETGVRVWGTFVAGGRLGVPYSTINDITADPVVVGNRIFVGNQSGRVVSLNAQTGRTQWAAREGSYSPLLVVDDSVFFISDRNELIRLDSGSGERIWGAELPLFVRERERRRKAIFTHYGPVLAGGRIYVASGDEVIRVFSPESGAQIGSLEINGGAASNPIVVEDTLLVVSTDGRLHAYR
ncbi:MAG: PQQ-binding-like beta-propeller repeat protein [Pseudomonadota bacterium]